MFPIRDHNPSGRTPYVTYALIAINVVVFLSTWPFITSQLEAYRFFNAWAMIPARVTSGYGWETILTSMFIHGGWMHLLGNMLFLWIFGDNMEDGLGHAGFLGFYLVAGLAAALLQIAGDPGSRIPMVGASGAIAGVMGGYLMLFPRARVDVLLIFIIFFRVVILPAWIVLGVWIGLQVFSSLAVTADGGGVAYLAHVGGFAAGLAMTLPIWLRRGGIGYWRRTHGRPPHPQAEYELSKSRIPVVRKRR
ncbi:rhomboid family intramembrane serine protease [Acidimangrovimonas pyrenivorans]|uniref:Rhomboid family intramembrane serine protease n=1 Tax=Acidimangrovimonas pyrenivorans TaxID=2030798 RepID=A0ABV7ABK2_9RHOB